MNEKIKTAAGTEAKTLPCHVVKDLLPLYVDGLTGEETSADIRAHLMECDDCRSQYEAMSGNILKEQEERQEQETKEIDYLKGIRRRNLRKVLAIACAALLIAGIFVIGIFVYGKADRSVAIKAEVNGKQLTVDAQTTNSSLALTGADFSEKDGVITVRVRSSLVWIRRSGSLSAQYDAKDDIIRVVDINGNILVENDVSIDDYVGRMFAKRVQYVGDASAVSALVRSVWLPGVDITLRDGMQLKTDSTPYGLILNANYDDSYYGYDRLRRQACLLLALIDNLDYVEYKIERRGISYDIKVTSQDALDGVLSLAAGNPDAADVLGAKNIKDFGKSVSSLQALAGCLEKTLGVLMPGAQTADVLGALSKLGVSLEAGVVPRYELKADGAGSRLHKVVTFSNEDELTTDYDIDGKLYFASYLDKDAGLLYEYEEGREGVSITGAE